MAELPKEGMSVDRPSWRAPAGERTEREIDMETKQILAGFAIVVADRGFVYVGDVEHGGGFCVVRNARNVRLWGTTKGLGELALNGPQPKTVLDPIGTVRIPDRAIISIIDTDGAKWTCK